MVIRGDDDFNWGVLLMTKYIQLENTSEIKFVSVDRFVKRLLDNNTRGYNGHEVVFYDDYISLSAPYNDSGYHDTLILTMEECKEFFDDEATMKEYYMYILERYYLDLFEEWVRDDERYKIKNKIEEILK